MFHPTLSKSGRILFAPMIKFCEFLGKHHPVLLVQIRYFVVFKKFANLKHPKNLNEKILYTKLFTDTSRWPDLVDKFKVRSHIESLGLKDTLVDLYGVWYDVDSFANAFATLPNSFILKANNGEGKGTNLVIKDKRIYEGAKFNELKEIISFWLSRKNIGALIAEPQYEDIVPCVIAEELLPLSEEQSSLTDYKLWCFNGKPYYTWVCNDRSKGGNSAHVMSYDAEWNTHPEFSIFNSDYQQGKPMKKPKNYERMLEVASKLSEGFPYLRVDLYNIDGRIYFGELTFTSQGGLMSFFTKEFLMLAGELFDVENLPKKK